MAPVLARFARPTAATPTTIAVLADLHLSVSETGTWRVSHRTESRLRAAVASLNDLDPDAVLFVGDLVQSGTRAEYEAFAEAVVDLEAPLLAVPGNHDLQADADDPLSLAAFERRYTPGELPYRERVGGVDLLALNSNRSTADALAGSYAGRLDSSTLEWLSDQLADADAPLVAVHHNLPPSRALLTENLPDIPAEGGSPGFETADDLVATLAGDAGLTLTGHLHIPAVTEDRGVRELTLPPLGPYPNAYTVLDVDHRGTTATLHSVANFAERTEALSHGVGQSRVFLSAVQLADLPLFDGRR